MIYVCTLDFFVGDDAYIVPSRHNQIGTILAVHTVYRFTVRDDVGIVPYSEIW